MSVKLGVCRNCPSSCPILVTVENGVIVEVEGDPDAPLYHGFICPKAKLLPAQHAAENRLLHSLKRMPDGGLAPISTGAAITEVTERLRSIIDEHGPQSVAVYLGGGVVEQPITGAVLGSFMSAIGSPMMFSAATIDQPGLCLADALHGVWQGGRIHPSRWEICLIVGGNPIVSKQHLPQNPGHQMKALVKAGARFIVVDPRRTETARRAALHLQAIPGEDPIVLAGLIHLIFALDGVDQDFVRQNAHGAEALRTATADFTPDYVAARAGIVAEDLVAAARMLIDAKGGETALGVGASMSTRGTLSSYLALCLQTLRGFWAREGEPVARPRVFMPRGMHKAQPGAPYTPWGFGLKTVRGLQQSLAGMPAAALPELMLSKGEDRIRALFLHAGAMRSWPDPKLTREALGALDLLVMHDVELNATSSLADYVIATCRQQETAVTSQHLEETGAYIHPGYDWTEPYGFYHAAVVDPPAGSDVVEAWRTYYRIAAGLGRTMRLGPAGPPGPVELDMAIEPDTDDLIEVLASASSVPLSRIKSHPHGAVFDEARGVVGPRDPECQARLELADGEMIAQLRQVRDEPVLARRKTSPDYPYLYVTRRVQTSTNSGVRPEGEKRAHNPLYMNPSDMKALALSAGAMVEIASRHGSIIGFAKPDPTLRQGVVAMSHGFGARPGQPYDPSVDGANVNDLLSWSDDYDPYHGMPRMSAVPVAVKPTNARGSLFPRPRRDLGKFAGEDTDVVAAVP